MPARVRIIIRSRDRELLRDALRREDLDLNCGGVKKAASGEWVVEAYAPAGVATRLRRAGLQVDVDREFEKRAAARRAEVGKGDRFRGGRIPPRGLGRKE
jgi:hypothetical protein